MSCYHPIKGFRTPHGVVFSELHRHDIIGDIELPCGMCIGCRMRRASDWELRVMHEAQSHEHSCFVTLTYGTGRVPPLGSLNHRDFQLFMKRLRKKYGAVRFYMCGEYGPLNQRPHYHACLFGVDFRADRVPSGRSKSGHLFYHSPTLETLWSHGLCTVQDLCRETAGYCARYIMKKALGVDAKTAYDVVDVDTGEVHKRVPEYARMSLKPGIGAAWFDKFGEDVSRHDHAISDGSKRSVPKYYDKLRKRNKDVRMDQVEYDRFKKAKARFEDNTDERLAVKEVVHLARVSTLKRGLE